MPTAGRPCEAPLPCSATREGDANAIELSVRGDTAQDGIPHAPSSNEGNIIPDRYLSDGFEGRCRVYSSLLHFISGTTVSDKRLSLSDHHSEHLMEF